MPKRSSKTSDLNQNAFNVVAQVTGQTETPAKQEKNPAAVALGKLGGLKGGVARAKSLSKARRKEIARAAAIKRWKQKSP